MEVISYDDINDIIKTGETLAFTAVTTASLPTEIIYHLVENHKKVGYPNDLTVLSSNNVSDYLGNIGIDLLVTEGMVKRYITNIFLTDTATRKAIENNELEAYTFPQGVTATHYRHNNGKSPDMYTKIGLHTHVDPRHGGGKTNDVTKEDLVELVELNGEEFLHYKYPRVDTLLFRGTYADKFGNIYMTQETFLGESFGAAVDARNNGGKVIVQVKQIVDSQSQNPKDVFLPGNLVDYVVVNEEPDLHMQLPRTQYNPLFSGEIKSPGPTKVDVPFGPKKVILRRALQFLEKDDLAVIGYGISNYSSMLLIEEDAYDSAQVMIDLGTIGGVQGAGAQNSGQQYNASAKIRHEMSWDMIYGGGVDIAYLSFAEVDQYGNVNVSRFGNKINGMGGFIDIAQSVKRIVFSGTMVVKDDTRVEGNQLVIDQEGKAPKFVENVQQIDFNGTYAKELGQEAYYVTDRAVFKLVEGGLELIEIARGLDLQKDVLDQMAFSPLIADDVKVMDEGIYQDVWGGLKDSIEGK